MSIHTVPPKFVVWSVYVRPIHILYSSIPVLHALTSFTKHRQGRNVICEISIFLLRQKILSPTLIRQFLTDSFFALVLHPSRFSTLKHTKKSKCLRCQFSEKQMLFITDMKYNEKKTVALFYLTSA